MTNCLARLMLAPAVWIATSVGPQAGECPVFPARENFTCQQFDVPTAAPPSQPAIQMPMKLQKTPDGYVVDMKESRILLKDGDVSSFTDSQGRTVEKKTICGRVTLANKKQFDAYMVREIKNGQAVGGVIFYTERGGFVSQGFEPAGGESKFLGGLRCNQGGPKPPPQ